MDMKKLRNLFVFTCLLGASALIVSCDNEKTISANELPSSAQEFINAHFSTAQIANVQKENEGLGGEEFKVHLNDGTEIKFDKSGEWKEVDAPGNASIPSQFIPQNILSHIAGNYTNASVVSVSKDSKRYEIELANGMDLKYDLAGNFEKVD